MNLDAITYKIVEKWLLAIKRGEKSPDELSALRFLNPDPAASLSHWDLQQALYSFCESNVTGVLGQMRRECGIAHSLKFPTLEALKHQLSEDFTLHQRPQWAIDPTIERNLQSRSALYFYLIESTHQLSAPSLARLIEVDHWRFRRRLNEGLKWLTNLIRTAEHHARSHRDKVSQLPPREYRDLVGIDPLIERTVKAVLQESSAHFINIQGIGGIGKTSLARVVAEELSQTGKFEEVLWITARQEWLDPRGERRSEADPVRSLDHIISSLAEKLGRSHLSSKSSQEKIEALANTFMTTPHLVIIDNLETLAESRKVVSTLYPLATGASRFLLTSREAVEQFDWVFPIIMPELSLEDSWKVLRAEQRYAYHSTLVSLPDATGIYEIVGGIPLALRLIGSQLQRHSAAEIIDEMRDLEKEKTAPKYKERLFEFIYRKTWHDLSEPARNLLIEMADTGSNGSTLEFLRRVTEINLLIFDQTLDELIKNSLIETHQDVHGAGINYRLHRLTLSFLLTQFPGLWLSS